MRRLIGIAAVTAALVLVFPVATVQAARAIPPLGVSFSVETSFLPEGGSGGPFTATGNAVAAGWMCPSGDTIDLGTMAAGFQSKTGVLYKVVKQFTCTDGSGTFVVKLEVRIDRRGDNFAWVVMGGTGNYASLRGSGTGYGEPTSYGVLDLYAGTVH